MERRHKKYYSRVRAIFADTDAMQVVYHVNYIKWFEADDEKCHRMALFIAGGIGEMLFEYKYIGTNKDKDSHKFIEEMIEFCVNTLDAPDEERKRYRKMILQHVSEMKRG